MVFQRCGALEQAHFFAKITKLLFPNIGSSPHILWETCFALGQEEKVGNIGLVRFDYDGAVERLGLPDK